MIPYEPFGSHDRYEPDEVDCWARWESKSETMEADLHTRLRTGADNKTGLFGISLLAKIGCLILQFFTERRN